MSKHEKSKMFEEFDVEKNCCCWFLSSKRQSQN